MNTNVQTPRDIIVIYSPRMAGYAKKNVKENKLPDFFDFTVMLS